MAILQIKPYYKYVKGVKTIIPPTPLYVQFKKGVMLYWLNANSNQYPKAYNGTLNQLQKFCGYCNYNLQFI